MNQQEIGTITQISMMTCINHRQKTGVNQEPKQDDCDKLPCQIGCPIAKQVEDTNKWFKDEFKLRKQEEKELMMRSK